MKFTFISKRHDVYDEQRVCRYQVPPGSRAISFTLSSVETEEVHSTTGWML